MRAVGWSRGTPFRHAAFSVAGRAAVAKSPPCPCVGLTVQDKRGLNLGQCDSVDTSAMAKTNWQPPHSAKAANLMSPRAQHLLIDLPSGHFAIAPTAIFYHSRPTSDRPESRARRRSTEENTREPRRLETQTQHPRPEGPRLSACEESWGKRGY